MSWHDVLARPRPRIRSSAFSRCVGGLIFMIVAGTPSLASACSLPSMLRSWLLEKAPDADKFDIVAKVKVLSLVHPYTYLDETGATFTQAGPVASGAVAVVLVTEGIKGATTGQRIQIAQGQHYCNIRLRVDAEGYVASNHTVEINGQPTPLIENR